MSSICEQHAAAFKKVSAFVVLKDDALIAKVAFKHPKDGAGRLYCYSHFIGLEMTRGFASGGGGYCKTDAACVDAANKLDSLAEGYRHAKELAVLKNALREDGGKHWDACLEDAGFRVFQAV